VNEASCVIQEAAHEDANIIFGAVVDPDLVGKVKITVIATGFDPHPNVRAASSLARTPVDMTPYNGEAARMRMDPPIVQAGPSLALRRQAPLPRRPIVDMPLAAAAGGGVAPIQAAPTNSDANSAGVFDDPSDAGSSFDVPAFLRRQEG